MQNLGWQDTQPLTADTLSSPTRDCATSESLRRVGCNHGSNKLLLGFGITSKARHHLLWRLDMEHTRPLSSGSVVRMPWCEGDYQLNM